MTKSVHANGSTKMTRHLHTMKGHSILVERLKKSLYYGENCGTPDMIDYPSMPLTEVSVHVFEKSVSSGSKGLDVFDMSFASRVARKACISPTSLMMAMIYLDRLKRQNPEYLRKVSPCDLFLVSIMIASKFLFDNGEEDEVFNDEWASSSGIDVKELNRLELEFLTAIDWNCNVDYDTFLQHLSKLEAFISFDQSIKRANGMTYNELLALFDYSSHKISLDNPLLSIIKIIAKVVLISSIAYISSVALAILLSTTITRTAVEDTPTLTKHTNNTIKFNEIGIYYKKDSSNSLVEIVPKFNNNLSGHKIDDKSEKVIFIERINRKKMYSFDMKSLFHSEYTSFAPLIHNIMPNKDQSFKYSIIKY